MKKTVLTIAISVIALTMVACSNQPTATPSTAPEESTVEQTYASVLANTFKAEIAANKDLATVAGTLASTGIAGELGCETMEISAGYLNGFDNAEISGFTKGYVFAPMIGAIPFIGYVFETTDATAAEALKTTLTSNANPRWNVCTEAADTVCEVVGNYVFFTMTPDPAEMDM